MGTCADESGAVMWTWVQRNGAFIGPSGKVAAYGYAGKGEGLNNPAMQHVKSVGPFPVGLYTMEAPVDTPKHGRYVIWLEPDPTNEMHGRSDFGLHGDKVTPPHDASEGCGILPYPIRVQAWESGDRRVRVVAEPEDV